LDNINVTKLKQMQKIKFTQLNELILNGDTYIPFKLHQLPSYYEEICTSDIVSLKGYTYINILALKSYNRNITTLNKNLDGQYSSSK